MKKLASTISNGILYLVLLLLYLVLFGLVFLFCAKIVSPNKVGMFFSKHLFLGFGMIVQGNLINSETTEVLGNWFFPFTLLLIIVSFFIIRFLLAKK